MAGTGLGIAGLDEPCHRVLLCHDLLVLVIRQLGSAVDVERAASTCRAFLAACRDPVVWERACATHWATKAARYHLTPDRRRQLLLAATGTWRDIFIQHERDGK